MKNYKKNMGNPAVIAASNPEVVKSVANTAPIIIKESRKSLLTVGAIIGGAAAIGATALGIKWAMRKRYIAKADTNPNIRAAIDIYNAIPEGSKNEFGVKDLVFPVVFIWDKLSLLWTSTDTDRILEIGRTITDWSECQKAFRKIYNTDLTVLLYKVLGPEKFELFLKRSQSDKNQIPVKEEKLEVGKPVITNKETIGYLFVNDVPPLVMQMKNRIPANAYVGKSTGKIATDKTSKKDYHLIDTGKKYNGKALYIGLPAKEVKLISLAEYSRNESKFKKSFTLGGVQC